MISSEPIIKVGILERRKRIEGFLRCEATVRGVKVQGSYSVERRGSVLRFRCGETTVEGEEILLEAKGGEGIEIHNVTIGIQFHWERSESQTFRGNLRWVMDAEGVTAVNEIGLEEYLASVISSEMSATSPLELLKAHAITSRSWLVAMLEASAKKKAAPVVASSPPPVEGEIIRWYDREDHALFDVCADDHCQRYQGISKIISDSARTAVEATRGVFAVHHDTVCDARYSKSCGGISEGFENVWENRRVPYLRSISDGEQDFVPVQTEEDARRFIMSRPDAYCNTSDKELLKQILPSFDQETADFFRWKVVLEQKELQELLLLKSGIRFGDIMDLIPLERGPSGRIVRLKVVGSEKTAVVGKELEIRKWFSRSHLYSSAFIVNAEGKRRPPERFTLNGAGWGHGVGFCQIGAAVMASKNKSAKEIILHYFRGAEVRKLY